jgi:hypothetical protein
MERCSALLPFPGGISGNFTKNRVRESHIPPGGKNAEIIGYLDNLTNIKRGIWGD